VGSRAKTEYCTFSKPVEHLGDSLREPALAAGAAG
jgi:hypothetical protein